MQISFVTMYVYKMSKSKLSKMSPIIVKDVPPYVSSSSIMLSSPSYPGWIGGFGAMKGAGDRGVDVVSMENRSKIGCWSVDMSMSTIYVSVCSHVVSSVKIKCGLP